MPTLHPSTPHERRIRPRAFAALTGIWLGLSLIKFGNPIILDRLVERPQGFWELVFNPWPVAWGYWMLAVLIIIGATISRFDVAAPRWLVILPLIWFAWQLAAGTRTVDAGLSRATLLHFGATISCFYLGLFALSRVQQMVWFWLPVLAALIAVRAAVMIVRSLRS